MSRNYSKFLTITLIVIIVAVIGLLAYLGYDYYKRVSTNSDSEAAVDAFTQDVSVSTSEGNVTPTQPSNSELNETELNNIDEGETTTSSTRTKPMYKGFYMLGTIEIPKISLKYTVLEKVTKKSLETSVAVIYPYENPVLNAIGNVVIVGHNYRNGVFFSNNKKLSKGDKIYITDLEKKRVAYTIYKIFQTTENDTKFYNRDTNGKREITLSTCTDDSKARLIIQAREE